MKVLVLGGAGQVARAVARAVPGRYQIEAMTRAELDITDEAAVAHALDRIRPQWIVNGAAYTAVDRAEDEAAQATATNEKAVGVLSGAAARIGCRILHLSTDFVFDGRTNRAYLPSDAANPLNVYGATKLGGEGKILSAGNGVVLRTAWVYASSGRNFVLTMLRLLKERELVNVVCDQIGTPTWASSVAEATWALIDVDAPGGIYHWTDLGVASWYDFAVAIQDEALALGLLSRAVSVRPILTSDYPTRAQRPAFSVLNSAETRALIKNPARHWQHNLRAMLDELRTP